VPGLALQFSKGEVNRAGALLAQFPSMASAPDLSAWLAARDCAQHFRACHGYPLQKVAMGVRTMVQTETRREPVVAQRHKRFPQMVRKLVRHPGMVLARMQDIGGCRALLADLDEQERVHRRIRRNWSVPDNRIKNYVASPQSTGYRAIHIVTVRDDRLIEVQLRTPGQHAWADNVETIAGATGWPLKDGEGPLEVLEFYRLSGDVIAIQEQGQDPDEDLVGRLAELRARTIQLVEERTRQ
jgi:hypothetical protein